MRHALVLAIGLLLNVSVVAALDIAAAIGRFGVAALENSVPDSGPDPVLNTLGGGVSINFKPGFWLGMEPGLDIYWTNYANYDGRAVPVEYETGDGNNVYVVGFLLDLPLVAGFRFGPMLTPELQKRFALSFSLGPAFLFRAGFKWDTTPDVADKMAANLDAVLNYFWTRGRWFTPSVGLRFETLLQERFTFVVGVRGFWPVSNLWTGIQPWYDHGTLHVMLGMRVALGDADAAAVPELVSTQVVPENSPAP